MKKYFHVLVFLIALSTLVFAFTSCAATGDNVDTDASQPPISDDADVPDEGNAAASPASTDNAEEEPTDGDADTTDTVEEGQSADSDADTTEEEQPEDGDTGITGPNTYAYAGDINPNQIIFSPEAEDYLSAFGSADNTLNRLAPMLLSAANAAYETGRVFYMDDAAVDAEFEWKTIIHLINTYAFEYEGVYQEDGNIIVPEVIMSLFFGDVFYSDQISPIPESMAGLIAYDDANTAYVITGADGGGISFVLRDVTISLSNSAEGDSQSATIQFDVVNSDGDVEDTVCVEIVHALSANYLYSVQSAYPIREDM